VNRDGNKLVSLLMENLCIDWVWIWVWEIPDFFLIGYGDGYVDVNIHSIILVPVISPSPFKLLKYS